jgi:hypothetical protein
VSQGLDSFGHAKGHWETSAERMKPTSQVERCKENGNTHWLGLEKKICDTVRQLLNYSLISDSTAETKI